MDTLDKKLTYTNCQGEQLVFGEGCLHYRAHELFNVNWTFETQGQSIRTAKLEAQERSFPVTVSGGSLEERNRVYKVFEKDAASGTTGTLAYGEWQMDAVCTTQVPDYWYIDDGLEERQLTLLFPRPLWVRNELYQFTVTDTTDAGTIAGGDYPKPYPYGYPMQASSKTIEVDTLGSSEFLWRVWGAAVDPYIIIDGNRYEVDCTVPANSRLELDTRERTIDLIDIKGNRETVLDKRVRGGNGSGTYAFRKLPNGTQVISSTGTFNYDIVIYNERTAPEWHA